MQDSMATDFGARFFSFVDIFGKTCTAAVF